MMLIHTVQVKLLSVPLRKPITTHLHTLKNIDCLVLSAHTNEGIIGHSLIRGLGKTSYQKVKLFIENELASQIINNSSISSKDAWQKFWKTNRLNGSTAYIYALAAWDIAWWDIFTKSNSTSLHQYLGGTRFEVPAYGTTGWLSLSNNELLQECDKYVKQGIKAFKIRLGHPEDNKRVALLRQAMGKDFILMVDANQRYSAQEAIHVAQSLIKFDITWFEEPVGNSVNDLIEVATNSSIPIAVGENITEYPEFDNVCKNKVASFLQPDVIRCGGITGFLEIAELVKNYNLRLCNHLLPELSVSLLGAYANSYMLEYDDLLPEGFFTQDFSIRNGCMKVPIVPGTGVEPTSSTLKRFSV